MQPGQFSPSKTSNTSQADYESADNPSHMANNRRKNMKH